MTMVAILRILLKTHHAQQLLKQLKELQLCIIIVVDKVHFSGHVDSWCHQNYNPSYKELDKV